MLTFRVRHKEEGWIGTLEIDADARVDYTASHRLGLTLKATIHQNPRDPTRNLYHEEPRISSLEELEILAYPALQ